MTKHRLLSAILGCALLFGCAAPAQPAPTATPVPPPTPAPTPPPELVLCIADSLEEDVPEYFAAIAEGVAGLRWDVTYVQNIGGFGDVQGLSDYKGVIALRTQQATSLQPLEAAAAQGVAVTIVDVHKGQQPQGVSYAAYEEGDLLTLVLGTALVYPPHDTPVRMLGLFSAEDSAAAQAYAQAVSEGKFMNRAAYYTNEEQTLLAFLEKQLNRYPEGMVDAIFVENMAMAMEVLDALRAAEREDMEVFAIPNSNMQEQQGLYHKYLFPAAFGIDLAEQAALQVQELERLFNGGEAQAWEFTTKVMLHGKFQGNE